MSIITIEHIKDNKDYRSYIAFIGLFLLILSLSFSNKILMWNGKMNKNNLWQSTSLHNPELEPETWKTIFDDMAHILAMKPKQWQLFDK